MNILVVNDDGINSRGLRELVETLTCKGDVYVAAPDGERSGFSRSITLGRKIHVKPREYRGANGAYAVDGTPVDCAKVGIQFFGEAGIEFDIVYSGINLGSNLGRDTNYSGTVGAAIEAALSGIPAVALSVDSHNPEYYGAARRIASEILNSTSGKDGGCISSEMLGLTLSEDSGHAYGGRYLNINVPHLPAEDIKGVRITTFGGRHYADSFREATGNDGRESRVVLQNADTEDVGTGWESCRGPYLLDGETVVHDSEKETSDIVAVARGYISITPARYDETDYDLIRTITKTAVSSSDTK